jgi:ParB family chromosome partitioning protein
MGADTMSRKDTLRTMLTRREDRLPAGNSTPDVDRTVPEVVQAMPHVRAGAVGAMGRSLGQIAHAAEHAKALIAAGSTVIEITPCDLDISFVSDRLDVEGGEFEALVDAIRETGQRSPILVRPHPIDQNRYQIVFGHRRVRVASRLGRQVRAVVQNLSDEEVVVIQGQENSARTDLSYIERGLFAIALEERGFDRRIIMTALSMEKTQLSKLLALTHSIPPELVKAIGPAPKAGRPRWAALAERFAQGAGMQGVEGVLADPLFKAADSDTRFMRVYSSLMNEPTALKPVLSQWSDDEGRRVASIERRGTKIAVIVDEAVAPAFGEFLIAQLPALSRDFRKEKAANQKK